MANQRRPVLPPFLRASQRASGLGDRRERNCPLFLRRTMKTYTAMNIAANPFVRALPLYVPSTKRSSDVCVH